MKIVKLKIDEQKGDRVVLRSEDKKQFVLPKETLPEDLNKGSSVYLKLQKELTENEDDRKKVAKAILEEILNGG